MRCLLLAIALALLSPDVGADPAANIKQSPAAAGLQKRCGWYSNPTPGNVWLYDRDGEWIIGEQGGHQVDGDSDGPDFKKNQWVETNGSYGYGCACLELRADPETRMVTAIGKTWPRPLKACRKDARLRKWRSRLQ